MINVTARAWVGLWGIGFIKQDSVLGVDSGTGTSVKLISRNSTGMSNMAAVGKTEDESEQDLITKGTIFFEDFNLVKQKTSSPNIMRKK